VVPLNSVVSALGKQEESSRPKELFKVPSEAQADERLTEDNFSRHLYSSFLIYTSPLTAIRLQMVKVKHRDADSKKIASKHVKIDSFSVLFRGPRDTPLESRIYRVVHDQFGTFDLFISPVNDSIKGRTYEAVFNRIQ